MSIQESVTPSPTAQPWYQGISRYQWTVLVIASLGWIFDVFEGQIFVTSMNEAMPALAPEGSQDGDISFYKNLANGAFLIGGALGGVAFGILSDRIGRKRVMTYTILVYSAFTCLSALSQTWWQMTLCRFLVALGVGGEWAVAAALVAEVFPTSARARSLSIFHASSILGTYLATLAGLVLPYIGWRWGFALGAAPALLIIWVRRSLKEPIRWQQAQAAAVEEHWPSPMWELVRGPWLFRALVGMFLAAIGLATFWGVHIYGKDRLRQAIEAHEILRQNFPSIKIKDWEMLGYFLIATGGGLGLLSFGPMCERLGRRGAFLLFHVGGLVSALVLFQVLTGVAALLMFLPIFGFLTLGMHAGYAVYFPELFPTRLRSTGAGFCFNSGRILAAPILFLAGWMQKERGFTLAGACSLLSLLFLVGVVLLAFAPETKGQDLPE